MPSSYRPNITVQVDWAYPPPPPPQKKKRKKGRKKKEKKKKKKLSQVYPVCTTLGKTCYSPVMPSSYHPNITVLVDWVHTPPPPKNNNNNKQNKKPNNNTQATTPSVSCVHKLRKDLLFPRFLSSLPLPASPLSWQPGCFLPGPVNRIQEERCNKQCSPDSPFF